MTDSPAVEIESDAALIARIRQLEKENAELSGASAKERPAGSRWRAIASALCIAIAAILVPVSIVGAWARVQLVDEDAFVQTLAPLAEDPAVQEMIIDQTMDAVTTQVDFAELTGSVFDGIAELGLPPRAADALALLEAPAAQGLEGLVSQTVTAVIESAAFAEVWSVATRAAHRALTTAATSDGGGLVVRTADGVGIQVGVIVERVQQTLVDQGVSVAQFIPAVDRVIIVGEGTGLDAVRVGYTIADALGWWLPVLTLALFGLGIALARRRGVAVMGTGIGMALSAGALAATFSIGQTAVALAAGNLDISPSALDVIYGRIVDGMTQTAVVLSMLGVFVALLGWVMSGSRTAVSVRTAARTTNAAVRTRLRARGLDTGAFGTWIGEHRVLVRTIVAVLGVLWLFSLRPLSLGDALLVIAVSFLVAWVLELLQRRPAEAPNGADDETDDAVDRDVDVDAESITTS
ncbi:hypothetical protein ACFQZV_11280 [Microbacterium koreense]|uniref:Integral membrane protein n=1 Tax=Microbacterium koreense TaxID=323761 RepID=A0ABW2ZT94_9MICO